ncbi:VanZ family protein [Geminicoccus roseus]|uniref:VanZ family protein n=1 Tax=Geminicoccus roseus TaxID=404900 RepID=UPI0003FBB23B|nr:VanZ family protein [Geminicoccus roseus]
MIEAHRPGRLRERFLVHEEISALLTPGLRVTALLVVLASYFVAVFWPLHWRLPKQQLNQVEIAADGHALFAKPGLLRSYQPPGWLDDVVQGLPLRVHLEVVPAPPHPRFIGRMFGLSGGANGRLLSLDREGPALLVHLRGKGTNHEGAPPIRVPNVFTDGVPVTIDLELLGPRLTVAIDGRQVINRTYPYDPRRRWNGTYQAVVGSDLNIRRYFLGEILKAEVQAGSRQVDLLAPGVLDRPPRMWFLHREPRLTMLEDLGTADAWQNVLGFVPLGMVAAIWPGATVFSVLATGLAVSGTIEFTQLTVPGRVPSVDDIITNVTGALLGWLVIFLLRLALDLWGASASARSTLSDARSR